MRLAAWNRFQFRGCVLIVNRASRFFEKIARSSADFGFFRANKIMLQIVYDRCLDIPSFNVRLSGCLHDLREMIENHIQLHFTGENVNFYMIHNGKKLESTDIGDGIIHIIPCLPGGKGGFGSMLRAIGAQIEKTTNREACRDLSGRRLRDINEEKRLKKWIAEQAEREKNAAERKKRKLSKLCVEPKHEFSDPDYDKSRSEMIDKVHDAVEEGLKSVQAPSQPSTSENKTPNGTTKKKKKTIKGALWVDEFDELDEDDEDELDESDEETPKKKIKIEK